MFPPEIFTMLSEGSSASSVAKAGTAACLTPGLSPGISGAGDISMLAETLSALLLHNDSALAFLLQQALGCSSWHH